MTDSRYEILNELLWDTKTEFVARELQEMHKHLKESIDNIGEGVPIFSYDEDEERKELEKNIAAVELVHSLYGTEKLKG